MERVEWNCSAVSTKYGDECRTRRGGIRLSDLNASLDHWVICCFESWEGGCACVSCIRESCQLLVMALPLANISDIFTHTTKQSKAARHFSSQIRIFISNRQASGIWVYHVLQGSSLWAPHDPPPASLHYLSPVVQVHLQRSPDIHRWYLALISGLHASPVSLLPLCIR